MGGGVSSHTRLRKAVVIKAYNSRESSDETFADQFRKYTYRKNGTNKLFIKIVDVRKCLALDAPWVDAIFKDTSGDELEEIEYGAFVEFLESGKLPKDKSQGPKRGIGENNKLTSPNRLPPVAGAKSTPSHGGKEMKVHPLFPPETPAQLQRRNGPGRPLQDFSSTSSSMYPSVVRSLGFSLVAPDSMALVRSTGLAVDLTPQDRARLPRPTKPLWRKREIVRQERTVQYTTVDADGALQDLVEREVSETEVLHMECRETGEFAHRETTQYEQTETFNNELVAEQRGKEEYVHLKSLEDEFEYMESNMPKKPGEEPQEEKGEGSRPEGSTGGPGSAGNPPYGGEGPGDGGDMGTVPNSPTMGDEADPRSRYRFDPDEDKSPEAYGYPPQGGRQPQPPTGAPGKYGWGSDFNADIASGYAFDDGADPSHSDMDMGPISMHDFGYHAEPRAGGAERDYYAQKGGRGGGRGRGRGRGTAGCDGSKDYATEANGIPGADQYDLDEDEEFRMWREQQRQEEDGRPLPHRGDVRGGGGGGEDEEEQERLLYEELLRRRAQVEEEQKDHGPSPSYQKGLSSKDEVHEGNLKERQRRKEKLFAPASPDPREGERGKDKDKEQSKAVDSEWKDEQKWQGDSIDE